MGLDHWYSILLIIAVIVLAEVLFRRRYPSRAVRVALLPGEERDRGTGRVRTDSINGEPYMDPIQITLRNNRERDFGIIPEDSHGARRPIDGLPTAESSDATIATATVSPDGGTLTVTTTGVNTLPNQPVRLTVSADAQIGDGSRIVTGAIDLTVIDALPEDAVDIRLEPGEERDR